MVTTLIDPMILSSRGSDYLSEFMQFRTTPLAPKIALTVFVITTALSLIEALNMYILQYYSSDGIRTMP